MIILSGCKQTSKSDFFLKKMTAKEILDLVRKRESMSEDVVYKDENGLVLEKDKLSHLDETKFFPDYYVDEKGKIVEIRVRKITKEDQILTKEDQIRDSLEQAIFTPIAVDCAKQREILERMLEEDQQNRKGSYDSLIDQKKQRLAISVLEHCGFPLKKDIGEKAMQALFLVIHHSNEKLRQKYFSKFKTAGNIGDLNLSSLALLEDRILMDKGEHQKYGTQVVKNLKTRKWELYPLINKDSVNHWRTEVGLESLEEYLKNFDLD